MMSGPLVCTRPGVWSPTVDHDPRPLPTSAFPWEEFFFGAFLQYRGEVYVPTTPESLLECLAEEPSAIKADTD